MISSEQTHARVNEPFQIAIPSNPTTGYRWNVASMPQSLRILDATFQPKPHAQPGDGGTEVFHLTAAESGDYRIEFVLPRPWENEQEDQHTVLVQVR